MKLETFVENGYLYVLPCLGGVTKFGRTINPSSRLASYRRAKSQNEFRITEGQTYAFLWECVFGNLERLESSCINALRRRFLNVRGEGFILEQENDIGEMVATIFESVSLEGGKLARCNPNLALYNSKEFVKFPVDHDALVFPRTDDWGKKKVIDDEPIKEKPVHQFNSDDVVPIRRRKVSFGD